MGYRETKFRASITAETPEGDKEIEVVFSGYLGEYDGTGGAEDIDYITIDGELGEISETEFRHRFGDEAEALLDRAFSDAEVYE